MTPPSAAKRYILKNLRLNPMLDAERILTNRDIYLGEPIVATATSSPEFDEKFQERREACRAKLDEIRAAFWTTSLPVLAQHLNALPTTQFPELAAAAQRLKNLAVHRPEFAKLAQHPRNDQSLFNAFKRVVVLPALEAGELKERTLQKLSNRTELGTIRRMVRILKRDFPDLYALESDWFDHVAGLKPRTEYTPSNSYSADDGDGCGMPVWLIVVIVITVLRILMYSMR